jgi:hypothetical protein
LKMGDVCVANQFRHERNNDVYQIYQGDNLVAEVRQSQDSHPTIIPMRSLSEEEQDEFHRYVGSLDNGLEG